MRKEKIRLEYMLKAGSGNIVWSYYQYSIRPGNMVCRQGDIQRQSIHLLLGKNRNTAS